jgi:methionyl-tRNA formyltransferase
VTDLNTLPQANGHEQGSARKTVILMGKGELAVRAAEWFLQSPLYDLTAVVPVMPEPTWTRSLAGWANAHGIAVIESGHYRDIPGVKNPPWNPDLVFSVFYDRIIQEWFIRKCKRILNLHNGPLPRYRGVSPINWALKNEEREHGVTIHEITPGIDDGPIVSQIKYSIYPEFDEVKDVYYRAIEYGWVLFQQTLPQLYRIEARPQNPSEALYYNKQQNALLGERANFTKGESWAGTNGGHSMSHAGEISK